MNRYPVWKFAIIVFALLLGVVYTLPNFFGEAPAVQVSSSKVSAKVDEATLKRVTEAIEAANVPAAAISLEGNSIKARFESTEQQLKAKDAIQTMEGTYVPMTPAETTQRATEAFKSGDWVQVGIDPTRHSYFFDRRTTLPVIKANEVLQIGNMILAKGVTFGSKDNFLYNLDTTKPVPSTSDIRAVKIKEYAKLRARLNRVASTVAKGEVSIDVQRDTARLLAALERKLPSADAVIVCDYGKGVVTQALLEGIRQLCRTRGVWLSLDPKPVHELSLVGLSLLTPNRREAFELAGVSDGTRNADPLKDPNLMRVADTLLMELSPVLLLITLGDLGMLLCQRGQRPFHIPTVAREVFDVSGAGDTVIASFTLAIAAGASPIEAAIFSNHAAGVVVGKVGTATVSPAELAENFRRE